MRILNGTQMREADRRTIDDVGIPSIVLMENAAREVVSTINKNFEHRMGRRVAVICGKGNNGGDGFVIARVMKEQGNDVLVLLLDFSGKTKGDARLNLDILKRLKLSVVEISSESVWEGQLKEVSDCGVIVDAIFGTGLCNPVTGIFQTVIADLNRTTVPIISVDLPSGLSADTNKIIGETVQAALTVTLAAPKIPLMLTPARDLVGHLVVADIGIPRSIIESIDEPYTYVLGEEEICAYIRSRKTDSHKGDYGHVLLVAGSVGKTGAAQLAGAAALRTGAGLVTVATPLSCLPIVAGQTPEYMTEGLEENEPGTVGIAALDRVLELPCDVVAVGPGLGTGQDQTMLVNGLLERTSVPIVIDADGLNALTTCPDRLKGTKERVVVITPHPGEMSRLTGISVDEIQNDRIENARRFATSQHIYVVLKGANTVIASPNGTVWVNSTGNPGMATGGTGDVLTGMVSAWLAQLSDPEIACKLAVYIHGMAGDLARKAFGVTSLIAGDVIERIGPALLQLDEKSSDGTTE